jgi:hypothetical protein
VLQRSPRFMLSIPGLALKSLRSLAIGMHRAGYTLWIEGGETSVVIEQVRKELRSLERNQ